MYKQVEHIIIPKQFVHKSITTLLTPAEAAGNSALLLLFCLKGIYLLSCFPRLVPMLIKRIGSKKALVKP